MGKKGINSGWLIGGGVIIAALLLSNKENDLFGGGGGSILSSEVPNKLPEILPRNIDTFALAYGNVTRSMGRTPMPLSGDFKPFGDLFGGRGGYIGGINPLDNPYLMTGSSAGGSVIGGAERLANTTILESRGSLELGGVGLESGGLGIG